MQVTHPDAPHAGTARRGRARTGRGRAGGVGALFAVCLVVTFANFAVWSLATPLFASPDEQAHVVRAAGVVRGQFVGVTLYGPGSPYTGVTVPKVFASGDTYPKCFHFHPTVPASCAPPLTTSTRTVRTYTYVGRYPPLYYAIVGLPSLAFVSKTGIYLMRLASALLNALLVSLALLAVVLWSRRKLLLVGVMVAATPMVWFLGGVVNPSGLEICAAICMWTAGLVLVLEHPERPPPGLVAVVAVAAGFLVLARPISPLWVACIAVVLGLLGGRRALLGVLRSRAARWSALPLAACGAYALWWIDDEHALDLLPVGAHVAPGDSGVHLLATLFEHTGGWLLQVVGVFGWLDTRSPLLTYVLWFAVVGLLVVLAALRAGARGAGVLALLLAAVVVVPIVISYGEAHRLGILWQGRYTLPLAVGVPLVSVALLAGSTSLAPLRQRAAVVLSVGIGVADIVAFLEALRRYAVGVNGPIDFLVGKWHPPLGLLGSAVAGCVLIVLMLVGVVFEACRPPVTGPPQVTTTKRQWRSSRGRHARSGRWTPATRRRAERASAGESSPKVPGPLGANAWDGTP